jgi:branched-chain amino acid transport system permease protein
MEFGSQSHRRLEEGSRGPLVGIMARATIPFLFMALAPLVLSVSQLYLAVIVMIWTLVGYGLYIPYSIAGQLTVATVTSYGAGAFAAALTASNWGWTFVAAAAAGIVCACVVGFVLALPVLRTKGQYFVILTLILAVAANSAAQQWSLTSGPASAGVFESKPISIGGLAITSIASTYILCLIAVMVVALSIVFLEHSKLGRRFAGIRENEELARSIGFSAARLKILALVLGTIPAGLGGAFLAFYQHEVELGNFDINAAITVVLMLIIGGAGSIYGPIVGATIVYFLPGAIGLGPTAQQIFYGVALCVIVIVLPKGIVGGLGMGLARLRFHQPNYPFKTVRRPMPHAESG